VLSEELVILTSVGAKKKIVGAQKILITIFSYIQIHYTKPYTNI
jgi:hypothetical protein